MKIENTENIDWHLLIAQTFVGPSLQAGRGRAKNQTASAMP